MWGVKISTFYEPLFGPREVHDRALIQFWKESWERNGWTTEVLSLKDCKTHPRFDEFKQQIERYPTVNDRNYERMCFLRHLAFAQSDANLFCDFDCINRNWNPAADDIRFKAQVHAFMTRHPALYTADASGFVWLLDWLMFWPKHDVEESGRPHISDQTIFTQLPISTDDVCLDYPNPGWENAHVNHFGNCRILNLPGTTKVEKLKRLLRY